MAAQGGPRVVRPAAKETGCPSSNMSKRHRPGPGPVRTSSPVIATSPKPRSTDGPRDGVVFGAGSPGRCWDVKGLPVCPALPLSVLGRWVLVGVSGHGGRWGEDGVVER